MPNSGAKSLNDIEIYAIVKKTYHNKDNTAI
jgi:hypothetical protein